MLKAPSGSGAGRNSDKQEMATILFFEDGWLDLAPCPIGGMNADAAPSPDSETVLFVDLSTHQHVRPVHVGVHSWQATIHTPLSWTGMLHKSGK